MSKGNVVIVGAARTPIGMYIYVCSIRVIFYVLNKSFSKYNKIKNFCYDRDLKWKYIVHESP